MTKVRPVGIRVDAYLVLGSVSLRPSQEVTLQVYPQLIFRGESIGFQGPAGDLELLWQGMWLKLPARLEPAYLTVMVGDPLTIRVRNSGRTVARTMLVAYGSAAQNSLGPRPDEPICVWGPPGFKLPVLP